MQEFCQSETESLEHLFRDYNFSNIIWMSTLGIRPNLGNSIPMGDWIKNFLNLLCERKKNVQETNIEEEFDSFVASLCAIWIH